MLLHGALPTAEFLWKRSIMDPPICRWCACEVQSALHLLRDCPFTKRVWSQVLELAGIQTFFGNGDVHDWIRSNLSKNCIRNDYGRV